LNSSIEALARADSEASKIASPQAGQYSPVTPGIVVLSPL
jgi:hypothetical protein